MSTPVRRSVALSVAGLLSSPAMGDRAYAAGGSGSSQTSTLPPPVEQMILVDSPGDTITAIFRLESTDPSQKFTWVVALPGKPAVGVSSNAVFRRLDAATAPQYWVEVTVEGRCMPPDDSGAASDAGGPGPGTSRASDATDPAATGAVAPAEAHGAPPAASGSGASGAPGTRRRAATATAVVVIDRGSVGPYDYVNLQVDPTLADPARGATDWLKNHGYDLSSLDPGTWTPSLRGGLHLLAFKLTHESDARAIRPVILTYESKVPTIPMASTVAVAQGIQVWVMGPSQAVPERGSSLVLNDAMFDWLTGRTYNAGTLPSGGVGPSDPHKVSKPSNYDAVVDAAIREAGGEGFVTELAAPASRFRDEVWSSTDEQHFATISGQHYTDGIDAVVMASGDYRGWDGWRDALEGATTLPAGLTIDEFDRNPEPFRGAVKVDTTRFIKLLDKDVIKPVADTATMFYQAPYLTRLYGRGRVEEATVDPAFTYNADLALVSDVHVAKQFVECSPEVHPLDAPWRVELPEGGGLVGKGRSSWPVAIGSMPANLKIVQLSSTGSGAVIKDNSDDIGTDLLRMAGMAGIWIARFRPPQNGVMIGGAQTVTPRGPAGSTQSSPAPPAAHRCSVSNAGGAAADMSLWWPQVGVILALRRRRTRRIEHGADAS